MAARPGSMKALLHVMAPWRPEAPAMGLGAAATILSVLALAGLALAAGAAPTAARTTAHAITPFALGGAAVLLGLRVLGAGRVVLRYVERLTTHRATFRALAALRIWLFQGLVGRSAGGLGFVRRGDALARLVNDVDALDGLYLRILIPLLAAAVLLPVLALLLGADNVWMAVAVCVLFALAAGLVPFLAARATLAEGVRLAEASAGLRVTILDALGSMREVRAFGNEGRMLAQVQAREAQQFDAQRVVARTAALAQAAALMCAQLALLLVLLAGGPPGALLPAVLLTLAAFEAAGAIPRAGALAGHAAAAAARIIEAAGTPPDLAAAPSPGPDIEVPVAIKGAHLRFEDVRFAWPGRPPTFDNLSLDIPAGARVAILGPSGAGKSTIAALALKVVAPSDGRILLGGADVAGLPARDVRARIAWLSQATHVFADTVRNNLLLMRSDADDQALWQALQQAGVADVVHGLPQGLETWIGEGGAGLSGGQQRRIALARTLLSPAPILILDEPATGLDDAAERAFLATLNDVAAGRTVILITHRLLGIERLDRIWRLSAGHAVAAAG